MFKGQPKGLYALALANTGERFGYYTMLAIFLLFLQAKFGFSAAAAGQFYAIFLAAVYFMPVIGGWLADKIGFGKCVVTGVCVMFIGYLCLAIPTNACASRGLALALMATLIQRNAQQHTAGEGEQRKQPVPRFLRGGLAQDRNDREVRSQRILPADRRSRFLRIQV